MESGSNLDDYVDDEDAYGEYWTVQDKATMDNLTWNKLARI